MANQGAKKRKDENTQEMSKLRVIMIACNILYILVRLLVSHARFTWNTLNYSMQPYRKEFLSHGSEGGVEDEKTRKKRKKIKRKASRGQVVKTRSR